MTSDNVIVSIKSIKLCSEVGNDEYINLCYFGGRRISGFEVIEGGLRDTPGFRKLKKPCLNRTKVL